MGDVAPCQHTHSHTQTWQTKKQQKPMSHPNLLQDLFFPIVTSYLPWKIQLLIWSIHTNNSPLVFSFQSFNSFSLILEHNIKLKCWNAHSFSQLAQFAWTYNWILPINIKAFLILIIQSSISLSTIHTDWPDFTTTSERRKMDGQKRTAV